MTISILAELLPFTPTSSPAAVSTLPLTNLTDASRTKYTQINATSATITLTLDNEWSVGAVFVARHNFEPSDTIRIRCYDGSSPQVEQYDSGTVDATPTVLNSEYASNNDPWGMTYDEYAPNRMYWDLFTAVSTKVIVIDITINEPSTSNIQVGDIYVGNPWSPTYNFNYNSGWLENDATKQHRMASGLIRTDFGPRWREVSFELGWLDDTDRFALVNELRQAGRHSPICVVGYPDSNYSGLGQDWALIGYRQNAINTTQTWANNHRTQIKIVEG
jgi:hypothetical protein